MNMCLLEIAMCEKCRSCHFLSEGRGVKSLRAKGGGGEGNNFRTGGVSDLGGIFAKGGQYPITCHVSDSKTSISMPKIKMML